MKDAGKDEYVVWSGEGECGTVTKYVATEAEIKKILDKERCDGDRWAYAVPSDWPEAECAASAKSASIY